MPNKDQFVFSDDDLFEDQPLHEDLISFLDRAPRSRIDDLAEERYLNQQIKDIFDI